ncbi:MAG: hypothetical protein ACK4VY_11950 [Brevundimonas sp.]
MIRTASLVAALPASAAAGAGVVGVAFAAAMAVVAAGGMAPYDLPYALFNLILFTGLAFVSAFMVFSAGIFLFGLPIWVLLHRIGRRSRTDAMIAGGVLSAIPPTALLIATGNLNDASAVAGVLSVALAGVAAGWTLHRVAYGRGSEV